MQQINAARSTNYLFTVGNSREVTYAVQSSNVADILLGETPYYAGAKDLFLPSNKIETSPLTIQLIISEGMEEWLFFYKWILKLKNNNSAHLDFTKPCELVSLDSQNNSVLRFRYTDCFPTAIGELNYSVIGESIVLTSDVTFRYNKFSVELPDGEIIADDWNGDI